MTARRLALFALVVLLLGLAAAAASPVAERAPDLAPPAADRAATGGLVTASLSPDTPAPEGRVRAAVGDLVRITVASDRLDTVSVGDLVTRGVEPDVPARLQLTAAAPGSYPITLQDARTQVGVLVVR